MRFLLVNKIFFQYYTVLGTFKVFKQVKLARDKKKTTYQGLEAAVTVK